MSFACIADAKLEETGFSYTLSPDPGEVQDDHPLLPGRVRGGAFQ